MTSRKKQSTWLGAVRLGKGFQEERWVSWVSRREMTFYVQNRRKRTFKAEGTDCLEVWRQETMCPVEGLHSVQDRIWSWEFSCSGLSTLDIIQRQWGVPLRAVSPFLLFYFVCLKTACLFLPLLCYASVSWFDALLWLTFTN